MDQILCETGLHFDCRIGPSTIHSHRKMKPMKNDTDRIIQLEIQLAHLQRQYDVLNVVVTEQSMQLDRATKQIAKWEQTVDRIKNATESLGDPLDEKPPHY